MLRGLGWLVSLVFLPAGNEAFALRIFSLRTVELSFADALLRQRFDSEQGSGQAPPLGGGAADGALEVFPACRNRSAFVAVSRVITAPGLLLPGFQTVSITFDFLL
ncbi:hypothetical protein D3C80_1810160 [compost metagenome]